MSQTYSFLDQSDILDSLTLFMKNQDEFKDFNFDGSGIKELLRVLAFNAQQGAFYNNFMYNELQLDSAQIDANVHSLASRIGYTASSKKASTIHSNITVTPTSVSTAPSSLTLTRDVSFYAVNDGATYNFSPDTIYTASLSNGTYVFNNVKLLQGSWTTNSFIVQTLYGFESYVIPNADIDTSTLEVYVRTSESSSDLTRYNVFSTAYDLGSNAKICFLRKNRDGFYEIRFGDGNLSAKLDYGNIITVKYLVTNGSDGNQISNVTPGTSIGGYYNIALTMTDTTSYGGADEESVDSVRNLAPVCFAASGNAVTTGDYVALTKKLFPEAKDVIAWNGKDNDPPKPGYVVLAVVPNSSATLSSAEKTSLINILDQYNVGSITPVVVDPDYIYINVVSTIKYDPKLLSITETGLTTKISDYCDKYSTNILQFFGSSLDMSKFSEYINAIDSCIVGNSTQINYERHLTPALNVSGAYVQKFYHGIKAGSVKITGFVVVDASSTGFTYYISDDSNGNLILYKTDGSNVIKLQSNLGSVDYANGVVSISNFVPTQLTNDSYVTISAQSSTYDQSITGVKSTILQIQNVSVTLESIR